MLSASFKELNWWKATSVSERSEDVWLVENMSGICFCDDGGIRQVLLAAKRRGSKQRLPSPLNGFVVGHPRRKKLKLSAVIFSRISFLSCILSLPNYNLSPYLIPFVSQPVILWWLQAWFCVVMPKQKRKIFFMLRPNVASLVSKSLAKTIIVDEIIYISRLIYSPRNDATRWGKKIFLLGEYFSLARLTEFHNLFSKQPCRLCTFRHTEGEGESCRLIIAQPAPPHTQPATL